MSQQAFLAMQRGRIGQRYVLSGENFSLKKLLALIAVMSGRKTLRIPSGIAQIAAVAVECFADHLTHRPPSATLEGVRIALWSKPVSIEKSRQELGYEPGLISVPWKKLCHRFWSIALGDYRKDADEQACAIAEPSAITAEQRAIGFANDLI
jgi:hypothetical protein